MSEDAVAHRVHLHWSVTRSMLQDVLTGPDSSRMALAFFILAALDLLGVGASTLDDSRRLELRDWILKCQLPTGGFCGSPNHKFPDAYHQYTPTLGSANLPATFFAILALNFVWDVDGIDRVKCLKWLGTLQRKDGSFGELIKNGRIEGGSDMRYCLCAAAIWWALKGDEWAKVANPGEAIDVDKLVKHIRDGQVPPPTMFSLSSCCN